MLTKLAVKTMLMAELTENFGYEKHQSSLKGAINARNVTTKKQLKGTAVRSKLRLTGVERVALRRFATQASKPFDSNG